MRRKRFFHFLTGTYNVLLMMLILLFIMRPEGNDHFYPGVWKLVFVASLIFGLFTSHHHKWIQILASCLAVPTLAFTWIGLFHETGWIEGGTVLFSAAFLFTCACSIVFDVVVRARVTLETLRGVICAYFLLAYVFAYLYLLVEYLHPGAMSVRGAPLPILPFYTYLSQMLYFSFITLLTIGYGDIVAMTNTAQSLVVLEGICGQFYVAMLVSRIIAVYSYFSDKKLQKVEQELHNR